MRYFLIILLSLIILFPACSDDEGGNTGSDFLQLTDARVGQVSILGNNPEVPASDDISLAFSYPVAPGFESAITLQNITESNQVNMQFSTADVNSLINIQTEEELKEGDDYVLMVSDELEGEDGERFSSTELPFSVEQDRLEVVTLSIGSTELSLTQRNTEIGLRPVFTVTFSHPVTLESLEQEVLLIGDKNYPLSVNALSDVEYKLQPEDSLRHLSKFNLLFPSSIGTDVERPFETVSAEIFTAVDETPKFPVVSDEELLTLVQEQTFKYFWDFAHPVSGLARERNTSGDVVTMGGSGFGLMAMIVGVERGFITRDQALDRWRQIFDFLEDADRFHGVWPHWMDGVTGEVRPFSMRDNGGDLVETAFLVQGMLTVRQYLDANVTAEAQLIDQINKLWESVEWSWYTRGGQNVLYWHWSPEYEWDINLAIRGHNETQIIYILAASSPTHTIDEEVYIQGYAGSGGMVNGNEYYGYNLPLGSTLGGPLFFAHYSYLGLDPRNLTGPYADYWEQNTNHSLINRAYCIDNPVDYVGYSDKCWGLTASDGDSGYSAHSPTNDRGVITPTAAISSIPYTPEASMDAIRHFYYSLGDRLWGEYGFYDAFNPTEGWVANSYLAIDQGPIICMIENHRSGLLWDLFMTAPEVQSGLDKLGFTY